MKPTKMKISVGMPVYNGEEYVEAAIRSILAQTDPDFELIISDNASTDSTADICKDLARQDSRIVYTRNASNIGAAANYNRLFSMASGEYFRWANADDLSGPTLHAKCLDALERNLDAVLAYGKTCIIDDQGRHIEDYDDNLNLQQVRPSDRYRTFFESVGLTNAIYGLMRASAMRQTSLMGKGRYPAADTYFMAELTLQGRFIEIPDRLFYRRMHPAAVSWDRGNQQREVQFWSAGSVKFILPTWRRHHACLKAIKRTSIDRSDKRRLFAYVARRMYWDRRRLAGELIQAPAQWFTAHKQTKEG